MLPSTGKLPRARRRVTISIIDSSSSSDEDEGASTDVDFVNNGEDRERKSSPSGASDRLAYPFDSANLDGSSATLSTPAETRSGVSERNRIVDAGSGSPEDAGARSEAELSDPWPDDVIENDGVLI